MRSTTRLGRSLIGVLAVMAALVVVPATAAQANVSASAEQDFVNRLNGARSAAGLPPLAVAGELVNNARTHSQWMGTNNTLAHNPNLSKQITNWVQLGENVGYGGSVSTIHNALMNSTGHRANILHTGYNQVGIGTWVSSSGRIWVTQVFRKTATAPAPEPPPDISTKAAQFSSQLGSPVTDEYAVPGGRARDYQGGDVLWSSQAGAHVVFGAILQRYRALAGPHSALRIPVTDELPTHAGVGRFNHFQGGSIYWTARTGAQEIRGAIRDTWARLGWERSALGYPITNELGTPDGVGRYNHFERDGSIYWTRGTGAREVRGSIRRLWGSMGWERSPLGYPTTDERPTHAGVGRFNHFQHGSIYWTPALGAHEVRGGIRDRWASMGWERSHLGYPVSNEYGIPGGRRSDFQGGSILWDARTGATTVR